MGKATHNINFRRYNILAKKDVVYVVDDSIIQVSDEIKNMAHEERMKRIMLFEEAGRREAETIPDTGPLESEIKPNP